MLGVGCRSVTNEFAEGVETFMEIWEQVATFSHCCHWFYTNVQTFTPTAGLSTACNELSFSSSPSLQRTGSVAALDALLIYAVKHRVFHETNRAGTAEPIHSHPGDDLTLVVEGQMSIQFFVRVRSKRVLTPTCAG
jgi:hypothetical protein